MASTVIIVVTMDYCTSKVLNSSETPPHYVLLLYDCLYESLMYCVYAFEMTDSMVTKTSTENLVRYCSCTTQCEVLRFVVTRLEIRSDALMMSGSLALHTRYVS